MWEEPIPPGEQPLSPVSARQGGNSMAGSTLQNSVSPSPVHFGQETTYSVPQVCYTICNAVCTCPITWVDMIPVDVVPRVSAGRLVIGL